MKCVLIVASLLSGFTYANECANYFGKPKVQTITGLESKEDIGEYYQFYGRSANARSYQAVATKSELSQVEVQITRAIAVIESFDKTKVAEILSRDHIVIQNKRSQMTYELEGRFNVEGRFSKDSSTWIMQDSENIYLWRYMRGQGGLLTIPLDRMVESLRGELRILETRNPIDNHPILTATFFVSVQNKNVLAMHSIDLKTGLTVYRGLAPSESLGDLN